ncbi:MAG: hypothetical protein K2J77_13130 [Oscillospiraceae bacterium]|nr:hypothetical protein [Oscillospiraceae bacterium]
MKVYELMAALSELPSGAEVFCSSMLSVDDVKSGIVADDEDKNNVLYEFYRPLDNVDTSCGRVDLGF